MRLKEKFQKFYQKNGRKAIALFLIYFVTKWTLTIVFGARLVTFFKDWIS
ncbi:MAG: hypothetical protein KDC44_20400 [Phaeodactylibacter sp.]|nr:hypothetical protein [Phaeodactylibacter sp.]